MSEDQGSRGEPEFILTFSFYMPTGATPGEAMSHTHGVIRNLRPSNGPGLPSNLFNFITENSHLIAAMAMQGFQTESRIPSQSVVESLKKHDYMLSEKKRKKHVLCSICQEEFCAPPSQAIPPREPGEGCSLPIVDSKETSGISAIPCIFPSVPSDDDEVNQESLLSLKCRHLFHSSCIKKWLTESSFCPHCKYELESDDTEYNAGVRLRMKERDESLALEDDTDDEGDDIVIDDAEESIALTIAQPSIVQSVRVSNRSSTRRARNGVTQDPIVTRRTVLASATPIIRTRRGTAAAVVIGTSSADSEEVLDGPSSNTRSRSSKRRRTGQPERRRS